jgi:hypothetical protein
VACQPDRAASAQQKIAKTAVSDIARARDATDFENAAETGGAEASLGADEIPPILKMFEREDWVSFRTVEGLQQKAGVPAAHLRRVVLKELADNALDTGASVRAGHIGDGYFIEDDGPGLDGGPESIAALFSIKRPMRSSKLLRLPQRGALGNGLRVVAGAVLASEGSLIVTTRKRRITLQPNTDGTTAVVMVEPADHAGTRIEISFGPALPQDPAALAWVVAAQQIAKVGDTYAGVTSAWWYDGAHFHELLLASSAQPVRSVIAQLDGCSGAKAGEIVTAAGLGRAACNQITREQAVTLLKAARDQARPVKPERLGQLGRDAFPDYCYAIERDVAAVGNSRPQADIPYVVEAFAKKRSDDKFSIILCVNRTPITGKISIHRESDKDLSVFGCGISHSTVDAPKKGGYDIKLSVLTPFTPITSDGKEPDLELFVDAIMTVIASATRKAQRAAPNDKKRPQKQVVLDNLDAVIAAVSDNGQYRFNQRQLLYRLRPIVKSEIDEDLKEGNFNAIITDYESDYGEIPGMYREPRGSIYHPHIRETITLGTLMVEKYERPAWLYNKLVYIEKEGFGEAVKDDGLAERHDCMPTSSKGFTTRAARDLVDKLAEHDEPATVFCVHDADAHGTVIYQTFQEATKARRARRIKIVNLGLEPWEAVADGLEIEDVPRGEKRKPVASYVLGRDAEYPNEAPGGISWEEWLQTHRVELNAMTTPQFLNWLERKIAEHGVGKLIPPDDVIAVELEKRLEVETRKAITERILREARVDDQVRDALAKIDRPKIHHLKDAIRDLFAHELESQWRDVIEAVVDDLVEADQ